MERRSALADPHLNRLNLSFQDRSVGGTMQRMVRPESVKIFATR